MTDNNTKTVNEKRAQQYLIFVTNRWGKNAKQLKYVIAQYVVGVGVSSTLLLSEIPKIIFGIYTFGIIVTNVTADGASENRSVCRSLANISTKEIFEKYT